MSNETSGVNTLDFSSESSFLCYNRTWNFRCYLAYYIKFENNTEKLAEWTSSFRSIGVDMYCLWLILRTKLLIINRF